MSEQQGSRPHHWWTLNAAHRRRGVVGAIAIGTGLAVVSAVVWASPSSTVARTAHQVAVAVVNPAAARLKVQNDHLTAKVTGLRREVSTRDHALSVAYRGGVPAGSAASATDFGTTDGTGGAPIAPRTPAATTPIPTPTAAPASDPAPASTPRSRPVRSPAARPAPTSAPTPTVAPSRPVPTVVPKPTSSPAPGAAVTRPPAPAAPTPAPAASASPKPVPVPVPVPTVTVTATPQPAPTVTVTPKPTPSATPTPKPTPTPTVPAGPKAPSRTTLLASTNRTFGLYTEQAPFNWATYDDAATKLTYAPQTAGYFSGWDEAFRSAAVTRAWSRGVMPVMTWESRPIDAANNVVDEPAYSLPRIIDGDFDDYLHTYAKAIVATGLPLAIRLDHEMNGTWYPWAEDDGHGHAINGNRQGDYVRMWRHVHDIFQQEGANDDVIWIWSPNRINKLTSTHKTLAYTTSLYPGDDYVDEVGLSGYLRPAYEAADDFSFDYTYGRSLAQLRQIAPGKRILLAEIGASEAGGHKVQWLNSMFDALASPGNADISGVLWFDLAVSTYTEGQLGTNDWRVDSRPDTLAAFRAGLARPDLGLGPLPDP